MATGLISTFDTGWVTPELTTAFSVYSSTYLIRYRRIGDIVTIHGAVTPTADITADNSLHTIFTLPFDCAPRWTTVEICQGSNQYLWSCVIQVDGKVSFYRYMRGSSESNCPAGAYLPFDVTFVVWG